MQFQKKEEEEGIEPKNLKGKERTIYMRGRKHERK
jgi:hypothetical protein